MSRDRSDGKMSARERATASFLRWLPWLAFLVCALPLTAYFIFQYFTATEAVGEYMLFALTSLGIGSLVGLLAAGLAFLYRRSWERGLREKLAAGGVTADHLPLFENELTAGQRRALKEMEAQNPLLADAYRETLAASLTAARVLSAARRDERAVNERLKAAAGLQSSGRAQLEEDLRGDRARLERVVREATEHRAEIETRLQSIEAIASRRASQAETELALRRLGSVREHAPLSLETARLESEMLEEVEQELRRSQSQMRELPSSSQPPDTP